jgi:hypothetical protein
MSYHATFRKFKKHFEKLKKDPITIYKKQLLTIKEHSKSIPALVLMDINNQLAKLIGENPTPPLVFNTQIKTVLFNLLTMYIR